MSDQVKLSHTAAMILQAVGAGYVYGLSVMERTGLPSGTVYPALRRLERDGLIHSRWEKGIIAEGEGRPPRKYYTVTRSGKAALDTAQKRYSHLTNLFPPKEKETA